MPSVRGEPAQEAADVPGPAEMAGGRRLLLSPGRRQPSPARNASPSSAHEQPAKFSLESLPVLGRPRSNYTVPFVLPGS